MNWRAIRAIIQKDIRVALKNRGVVLPIIILPLVMFVFLPWLSVLAPNEINMAGNNLEEVDQLIDMMPSGLQQEMAPYNMEQKMVVFFLVYMLAPMFILVPMMVSSVIAADSFAGEKERKTLEALLYTPTSDAELFTGKMLGAWLPALVVAAIGFCIYAINVNLAGWGTMGRIFFPNVMWIVLLVWVTPAVSALGMMAMVFASARAQGFQDAYQVGGLVVLPVILLMFGQISGVMYFSVGAVFLVGVAIWAIDAVLLWLASRQISRSELISKF
jgi:ABC-2 type transport system permease protein